MGLDDITYQSGKMEYRSRRACEPEFALEGYLEEAKRIIARAEGADRREPARTAATSVEFEREILRGSEGIKPEWVRVDFG